MTSMSFLLMSSNHTLPILVADDDLIWQNILVSFANACSADCRVAENWSRVWYLLKNNKFSHFVTDLSLGPDSNGGLDALEMLNDQNPPKTMVVCTHYSNAILQRCNKLHFVKLVVPKPRISEYLSDILEFFDYKFDEGQLRRLLRLKDAAPVNEEEKMEDYDRNSIFVVHGRNEKARKAMFEFLRSMELKPIEWGEAIKSTKSGSPFIGEVLDKALSGAGAVVVLLTGDDEGQLAKKYVKPSDLEHDRNLTPQPRLNVVFEAGMAISAFPTRTIFVQFGPNRPFSDIQGRHLIHYGVDKDFRNNLATRLEATGCKVVRSGTDWLSAGAFKKVMT
jgi:predicted nucleotide-binding protein